MPAFPQSGRSAAWKLPSPLGDFLTESGQCQEGILYSLSDFYFCQLHQINHNLASTTLEVHSHRARRLISSGSDSHASLAARDISCKPPLPELSSVAPVFSESLSGTPDTLGNETIDQMLRLRRLTIKTGSKDPKMCSRSRSRNQSTVHAAVLKSHVFQR